MGSFDFFFPNSKRWRKANVKYSQNELYLDVVEEMDAIISANGQVMTDLEKPVLTFPASTSFEFEFELNEV